jgi:hypothetical protein
MLWYKILQNTTYCGILHFISCNIYEIHRGSLVKDAQESNPIIKRFFAFVTSTARNLFLSNSLQPTMTKEET